MANSTDVFSDDWWGRSRPVVELHGYFRTRAELFQNFSLGRHNSTTDTVGDNQYLWPIPLDNSYSKANGNSGPQVSVCGSNTPKPNQPCYDKTESGANLRLRINPEIHISDNLHASSHSSIFWTTWSSGRRPTLTHCSPRRARALRQAQPREVTRPPVAMGMHRSASSRRPKVPPPRA